MMFFGMSYLCNSVFMYPAKLSTKTHSFTNCFTFKVGVGVSVGVSIGVGVRVDAREIFFVLFF